MIKQILNNNTEDLSKLQQLMEVYMGEYVNMFSKDQIKNVGLNFGFNCNNEFHMNINLLNENDNTAKVEIKIDSKNYLQVTLIVNKDEVIDMKLKINENIKKELISLYF